MLLTVLALAVLCVPCLSDSPSYQRLFNDRDGNNDGALSQREFINFWLMDFDTDHDGRITPSELRNEWRHDHLSHSDHSLMFFTEVDLNHDTVIDDTDLITLFNMFDENKDNYIGYDEFVEVWDALFDDVIDLHH